MRIISYNVNGLRAAIKKGFLQWLKTHPAEVVCIQEAKAQQSDVIADEFNELGYKDYWFCAQKKGDSGVTVFSKIEPDDVQCGTGHALSDDEGRVIQLDFGAVRLINAYFPSGTTGTERQTFKYTWMNEFFVYLEELRTKRPHLILCGDYNIAHREIDIHSPKTNQKTSGFLPEERAWLDKLYSSGWTDTFRNQRPDEKDRYTWWTQRFPSVRRENKGWRLDYISVTDSLRPLIRDAEIYPHIQHSDHCPVYAELDLQSLKS
jgi:exodeoxyribonuclease-3